MQTGSVFEVAKDSGQHSFTCHGSPDVFCFIHVMASVSRFNQFYALCFVTLLCIGHVSVLHELISVCTKLSAFRTSDLLLYPLADAVGGGL